MKRSRVLGALLAAIGLSGAALAADIYEVDGMNVNIRSAPSLNAKVLTQLQRGTKLQVIEEAEDWYKIALPDGKNGYIYNDLVAVHDSEAEQVKEEELPDDKSVGEISAEEMEKEENEAAAAEATAAGAGPAAKAAATPSPTAATAPAVAAPPAPPTAPKTGEVVPSSPVATSATAATAVPATAAPSPAAPPAPAASPETKPEKPETPAPAATAKTETEETAEDAGQPAAETAPPPKTEANKTEPPKESAPTAIAEENYILETEKTWVSLTLEPGISYLRGSCKQVFKNHDLNIAGKVSAFFIPWLGLELGYEYARLRPGTNSQGFIGGLRGRARILPWMRFEPDFDAGYYIFGHDRSFGWQTGGALFFGKELFDFAPFLGPFFKYEHIYTEKTPDPQMWTFGLAISLSSLAESL